MERDTQVPVSVKEEAMSDPRRPLIRRCLATGIDFVVVAALALVVNSVIPEAIHQQIRWLGGVIAVVLFVAYYVVLEGAWGLTVGKLATRLRVVTTDGSRPGFGRALVRTLLRSFEVNPLLFGGLPAGVVAYFSKSGQRIGDMLSSTYVLETARIEAVKKAALDQGAAS
jgi:uncharacterized RDD family membrane protein YckC